MKLKQLDLKRGMKVLSRIVSIACCSALFAVNAQADQIKVFDNAGLQRSIAQVQPGSTVDVSIVIESNTANTDKVAVSLLRKADKEIVRSGTTNSKGHVKLTDVIAGNYTVGIKNDGVTIKSVSIKQAVPSTAKSSAELSKGQTTALYVGGISAVGGGIAAIASNSGSSSSSRANLSGSGSLAETGSAAAASSSSSSTASRLAGTPLAPVQRVDTNNDGIDDAPAVDPDDIETEPVDEEDFTVNEPVDNVVGTAGPGTSDDGEEDEEVDLGDAAGDTGAAPVAPTPSPAPAISGS